MRPPHADRRPQTLVNHGVERVDEYAWLRRLEDPAVSAYLKAENAYTDEVMAPHRELQEALYQEMLSRILEDDVSPQVPDGTYCYYERSESGKAYSIPCRRPRRGGPEQVLLDPNELAVGLPHFDLGLCEVSPNHGLLAYGLDVVGDESYEIRFKDLQSGENYGDSVSGAAANLVWANDNKTVYYTLLDESHRPYRVMRHVLHEPVSQDQIIAEEGDPSFFVSLASTRDRAFVTVHSDSQVTSEISWFPADGAVRQPRMIWPRVKNIECDVWHNGGLWVCLTNRDAPNFQVLRIDASGNELDALIQHRGDVMIEDLELFDHHLVSLERVKGLTQVWIRNLESGQARQVQLPDAIYQVGFEHNPEPHSPVVRLVYSSPVTPRSILAVDLNDLTVNSLKQTEVLGGFCREDYACERIWATSCDGTQVPVSLIYRKDREPRPSPLLLHGYGAYGISLEANFRSTRLSLLNRGFVIALAHVRGGSELGRQWYDDGRLANKRHSFEDFIGVAEMLIERGYTAINRLFIHGGSAGGLLVGAAINLRPDLFFGAIAHVPFVDVLNTMLDDSLPLTAIEYDEWGDPNRKDDFNRILDYSPYDQIVDAVYPHMLVTAGLNDPRVGFWEPAKWVARIRDHQKGNSTVLLKTNLEAGHFGASGRYEILRELAFDYAFIFAMLETS